MKKLCLLAGLSALIFASCTKSEPQPVDLNDRVVIEFTTVKEAVTNRSGLYTSENVHKVNAVNLYAFKLDAGSGDYLWEQTIEIPWTLALDSKTYQLAPGLLTAGATYKLMAVGFENAAHYTLTTLDNTVNYDNFSASSAAANRPDINSAIFTGTSTIEVGTEGGGRSSILMKRKVAGLLGYFVNVPAFVGNQAVEVIAIVIEDNTTGKANLTVNLSTGLGSNPRTGKTSLMAVDLRGMETVERPDGSFVFTGNNPGDAIVKQPNTILNGSFIIPALQVSLKLAIGTITSDNQLGVLQEWPIIMTNDQSLTFDLTANNFYTLGSKPTAGTVNGDNPIDLDNITSVSMTVSPDWESIYDLDVQDPVIP